jgi:hypothetical protein
MSDVKTLTDLCGGRTNRDAGVRRLEHAAREAWAEGAREKRWTLWVRLSFPLHVSEITATKHILNWATQLRAAMPGVAVLVGLHNDTSRLHAHALVFVPRRWTNPFHPHGIFVVSRCWEAWLGWRPTYRRPHRRRQHGRLRVHTTPSSLEGQVWVQPYDPTRRSTAPSHRGAAEYLARDPGSVMSFGTAPLLKENARKTLLD